MPTAEPLEIKVIYSASPRHRRRGPAVHRARHGRRGLALLALIHLAAAGAGYYGVWWEANRDLHVKMLLFTDLGLDPSVTAHAIMPDRPGANETKRPSSSAAKGPKTPPRPSSTTTTTAGRPSSPPRLAAARPAWILPATIVGWEFLATVALCALALSGAALAARSGVGGFRPVVLGLALVAFAVAGWRMRGLWLQYEDVTPGLIRYGVAGLVSLTAAVGLLLPRRMKGCSYAAAVALIVSAAATAVGLHIGAGYGAVKAEHAAPKFLALAFAAQSLWGWILLPLTARLRR